jgi:ribosomal protein S27AE
MVEQDKYFKTNVRDCPRCGHDHKALTFKRFTRAADKYTHFCICPQNHEPILGHKLIIAKGE